ncbi:MAG: DnaJ domain-containing protein [Cyanobacteria bacterium P01_A01_bin.105]
MANTDFSSEWIKVAERDPYAALGLSVVADERRITKRYRQIAKRLHPDTQVGRPAAEQMFAQQVLAKIVNPAYQRLKQENTRSEALASLRFKVRRMARNEKLKPTFESAQQLLRLPEDEVDGFYENTLTQLAAQQFNSPARFHQILPRVAQLNLILLRRKMSDAVIRPKRTGLVAAPSPVKPETRSDLGTAPPPAPPEINYAERYAIRARTYLTQRNYDQAIQELREGVKIEPNRVEFHSMLGQAYLMQKKYGMSRVHLKRALVIKPGHAIAQKYLDRLEVLANRTAKSGTAKSGAAKSGIPRSGAAKSGTSPSVSSNAEPIPQGSDRSWLGRIFNR